MKKFIRFLLALILTVPLFILGIPFWVFLDWISTDQYTWDKSTTQSAFLDWKNMLTFGNIG